MTNEETTGTPPTDDGDAVAQTPTTGTPDGDGRDAASDEPDYKAMHLANKSTIEKLNAEVEALRMRAEQPPAAHDDDEQASDPGDGDLTSDDVAALRDLASRGDVVAKAQLVNHLRQQQLARDVRDSFHIRDIDDRDERKEVLAHYARNRHRLGDVRAAEAEVRKRKLETEVDRLKKELEAARKQPPTDVVRTHSREVSSSEAKRRKTTYDDFDREIADLKARGQFKEAMKRQVQLANGEIDIE